MTFNEYVESKTYLIKSLGKILDLQVGPSHYILKDIVVHQPKFEYTECLVRQIPYCYKVDLILQIDKGDNVGKERKYTIEVPKMCEHGFLISDPDNGRVKFRSPILIGELNQKLFYRGNKQKHNRKIVIGYFLYIYIDPDKSGFPSITIYKGSEDEAPLVRYPLVGYLDNYGININDLPPELSRKFPKLDPNDYGLIGLPENDIEYYNNKILQLTKKNPKLTKENPYISAQIIFDLVTLAIKNPLAFEPFTPFDITFMDFSKALFEVDLQRQKYIKNKLANIITKGGDIGYSITKNIYASFSMQTESGSVQVASTSNALSFLSQSHKIYFKKYKKNDKKRLIYSGDFYGLICPSKTPESVTLTSSKNEVASDVSFDENHNVMIAVIPKESFLKGELKSINIPYPQYYQSRILSIDNIDYRIMKVIPHNGKVKIFYLGEFEEVKYTGDDCYDYIRQSPEGALSYNAGLIPMANRCDGTRLSMATGMMDQAIPVLGAHKSIVKTSLSKLVFDKSNFNIKSPVDGEVVRLVDGYITVQLSDKSYKTFSVPDTINTSMHTSNRFLPYVQVGDKIKKGDPLYISDSFKGNELALTVPLRVAYYSYGMLNSEDAVVISESASKLLSHKITRHIKITIPSDTEALFDKSLVEESLNNMGRLASYSDKLNNLNQFGLPIIGVEYSNLKRDCLSIYQTIDTTKNTPQGVLMKLLRTKKKKSINQLYQILMEPLPHDLSEGTVESVRIFHKNTKEVVETYKNLIEYYDSIHDAQLKNIRGDLKTEIPEFNINLPDNGKIDLAIIVTISSVNECGISSKITTRYASKGTISDVIPDDEMPRINDANGLPIQIMIPPQSTINRKNIAQIYEMNLCLICKLAFDRNENNIKVNNYKDFRDVLNKLYLTDKFNDYSNEDLIKFHKTFDDYYSVEVNSIDNLYTQKVMSDLCDFFGVDQDGYYLYDPKESERITLNKVSVGITEIMRLHFIPEFKAKSTADTLDSDTVVLFGGDTREGGQKIGEMERWQIQAHGIEAPINNLMTNSGQLSLDDNTNIMLLNEARVAGIEYELYKELGKI